MHPQFIYLYSKCEILTTKASYLLINCRLEIFSYLFQLMVDAFAKQNGTGTDSPMSSFEIRGFG